MEMAIPKPDIFKSELVHSARFSHPHEFPILETAHFKPYEAVAFEKVCGRGHRTSRKWIHFYTFDHRFERVWNNPQRYLPLFRRFGGVISPDFSLYRELPLAMQIWNTYRNRALAHWLQQNGINVVPNIRWGDERSYGFVFEGLVPGGSFAIGSYGCIQNKLDRWHFKKGLAQMMKTLMPRTLINYGQVPFDIFGKYLDAGVEVIQILDHASTMRKAAV